VKKGGSLSERTLQVAAGSIITVTAMLHIVSGATPVQSQYSKDHHMSEETWLTGASCGFGRVWTEAALKRGDTVVATATRSSCETRMLYLAETRLYLHSPCRINAAQ
jgi:hypothetical protein